MPNCWYQVSLFQNDWINYQIAFRRSLGRPDFLLLKLSVSQKRGNILDLHELLSLPLNYLPCSFSRNAYDSHKWKADVALTLWVFHSWTKKFVLLALIQKIDFSSFFLQPFQLPTVSVSHSNHFLFLTILHLSIKTTFPLELPLKTHPGIPSWKVPSHLRIL